MLSLEMPGTLHAQLQVHLFGGAGTTDLPEQAAFLFTKPYDGGEVLSVKDAHLSLQSDFVFQSGFHIHLADEMRPMLIRHAIEENACLIEVHSHNHRGVVSFSGSDLAGFDEWVPHVRWRLGGRPYVALVFGYDTFDALCWRNGVPEKLARIAFDHGGELFPTSATFRRLQSRGLRS